MTRTATFTCWRDASHQTQVHEPFGWPECEVCGAAPPYYDRIKYLDPDYQLALVVPNLDTPPKSRVHIERGSGIVGFPLEWETTDRWQIEYEGFVYGPPTDLAGATPFERWKGGVRQAAGRCVTNYPTVARAWVVGGTLIQVGSFNPTTDQFTITDQAAIDAWLAPEEAR